MKLFVLISLPVLILLNIYDIYSTYFLIGIGVEELNPYIRWVISHFGIIPAMLVTKGIPFGMLFWVSYKVCTRTDPIKRENIIIVSAFIIMISFYAYFMYTRNFQYMMHFS
jgi:hypothetical protein